jgi:hypothetical protein
MRSVAALLGLCAAVVVALALIVVVQQRDLAFTLGVPDNAPVGELNRSQVACQRPVAIPDSAAEFDRMSVKLGTYGKPGPPVEAVIRSGARQVARARLAGGYADNTRQTFAFGRVTERGAMSVCLRNLGPGRVAIYGAADAAARDSTATLGDKPLGADLDLVFERSHSRSIASLIPAMLDRAALFRASWIGPWLYVLLGLLVLLGIPALLALALRDATDA